MTWHEIHSRSNKNLREEVRRGQGQSQIRYFPDPPSGTHNEFITAIRGSEKKGARTQYSRDGVPRGSHLRSGNSGQGVLFLSMS